MIRLLRWCWSIHAECARDVWHSLRWLAAEARWCVKTAGYWIRPYDMVADARRWRWRHRRRCGWSRFARGGVIHGRRDPGDDSIPFLLSECHAWIPAATVARFGENLLREIGRVHHIHPAAGSTFVDQDELLAVTRAIHDVDCDAGPDCEEVLTVEGRYGRYASVALAVVAERKR